MQIVLRDFGPGVPPAQFERLFEPFYRMEDSRNRQTGGIGLGLPIARNVVRAHGGDLTLANHKQGGLVVTVVAGSVTTHWNWSPLMAVVAPVTVSVALVAPV